MGCKIYRTKFRKLFMCHYYIATFFCYFALRLTRACPFCYPAHFFYEAKKYLLFYDHCQFIFIIPGLNRLYLRLCYRQCLAYLQYRRFQHYFLCLERTMFGK